MKIFIASSASEQVLNEYKNLASSVATILARKNHKLVFGGCDTGMMGKCFYTFKYENKKVKGIRDINGSDELKKLELDASKITPTTFERTKELFLASDMCVILPGGLATLAELFSICDEKRTTKRDYPIILFNYDNYYTPILDFLIKSHSLGFTTDLDLKQFDIITNTNSLEKYIDTLEGEEN